MEFVNNVFKYLGYINTILLNESSFRHAEKIHNSKNSILYFFNRSIPLALKLKAELQVLAICLVTISSLS